MKKIYLLIAGLLLALALLITGSVLLDKQLKKDSSFISDRVDFDKTAYSHTADSASGTNVNSAFPLMEMEVTENEKTLKDLSDVASDHEIIFTDLGELEVDAMLTEEEWGLRIQNGINASNINEYNRLCSNLFYYNQLDSKTKQTYLEIYISLLNFTDSFYICTIDPEEIDYAFNCVMGDHPEIFYVNGYMFTKYTIEGVIIKVEFTPGYTMTEDEAGEYFAHIKAYKDAFLKGISRSATDYEKVKYTYEFVILNTEYDLNSEENQNILSVFMYGKSVCQGYSKAFQYLLSQLDVQSALVVGYVSNNEGHAWNIVRCNGQYYYIDCTWGDSSYMNNASAASGLGINYDYLNITTEELEKTHIIDNFADIPECNSIRDNYYVREGYYFSRVDESQISEVFNKAVNEGRPSVEIKCSDAKTYDNMGVYLLDENHIFDYMPASMDTLTYVKNTEMYIYSFPLNN